MPPPGASSALQSGPLLRQLSEFSNILAPAGLKAYSPSFLFLGKDFRPVFLRVFKLKLAMNLRGPPQPLDLTLPSECLGFYLFDFLFVFVCLFPGQKLLQLLKYLNFNNAQTSLSLLADTYSEHLRE